MATATQPTPEAAPVPVEPEFEHYEVVDGQVVETPPMGVFECWIASYLVQTLGIHATTNRLGRVVVETLFLIDRDRNRRRRPDVAFVSYERWPLQRRLSSEATWDVIPDLAIEVVSRSNTATHVMEKLEDYFRAGVRLVWVVYPEQGKMYVYESPTALRILDVGDDLDGGAVLPGIRLPLSTLFTSEGEPTEA